METMYTPKKSVKKTVEDLKKYGLTTLAEELESKDKVSYEELARYESKVMQALKESQDIKKTGWEKKIVEKVGNPDGTPSKDCWLKDSKDLANIMKSEDEDFGGTEEFGFYTYSGEVCVLTSDGYDCDFDSFPEAFQKRFWEKVEAEEYVVE